MQRGPHGSDTAATFPRAPPLPPLLTPLIGPHLVIADHFPPPPRRSAPAFGADPASAAEHSRWRPLTPLPSGCMPGSLPVCPCGTRPTRLPTPLRTGSGIALGLGTLLGSTPTHHPGSCVRSPGHTVAVPGDAHGPVGEGQGHRHCNLGTWPWLPVKKVGTTGWAVRHCHTPRRQRSFQVTRETPAVKGGAGPGRGGSAG